MNDIVNIDIVGKSGTGKGVIANFISCALKDAGYIVDEIRGDTRYSILVNCPEAMTKQNHTMIKVLQSIISSLDGGFPAIRKCVGFESIINPTPTNIGGLKKLKRQIMKGEKTITEAQLFKQFGIEEKVKV
jgi:ABC-type dipeptide/oligopeptide/nickel transport system ATPase component